tara:strand:- start:173 stop:766 length:594 start_codon:yes stop_codon:yes gene_type:complete
MSSKEHNFNLNTRGSKLSYLTSGSVAGGIHYLKGNAVASAAAVVAAGNDTDVTGVAFPIGLGNAGGTPFSDSTVANQIGDPQEKSYALAKADFVNSDGTEAHGGAQKFVNAVLDGAFVAYDSGVKQGSGLSSMTVSRGDLTLNNSKVTGISGVVNTYSRSYSVTFSYKQSGMITAGGVSALPDITNDLSSEAGDGPF